MSAPAAEQVSRALKALADPLRLRALSLIAASPRGEVCVEDVSALTAVSQPTVSHHLKVLKDAGLVTAERRGTDRSRLPSRSGPKGDRCGRG